MPPKSSQSKSKSKPQENNFPSICKIMFIFFFFLMACLIAVHLQGLKLKEDRGMYRLTTSSFDSAATAFDNLVILFVSSSCSTCTHLEKQLENEVGGFNGLDVQVKVAIIDGSQNQALADRFKINNKYPSVFLHNQKGIKQFQNDNLSGDMIFKWTKKQLLPTSRLLQDGEDLALIRQETDTVIIFTGPENSKQFKDFMSVSESVLIGEFAHTFDKDLLKSGSSPDVTIFTFFQKDGIKFSSTGQQLNKENLESFIKLESKPYLLEFEQPAIELIFQRQQAPNVVFLLVQDDDKDTLKTFEDVARAFKGQDILFTISRSSHEIFPKLSEFLGFTDEKYPKMTAMKVLPESQDKYNFNGQFDRLDMASFVEKYQAGKLEVTLKSEEIPTEQPDAVQVVVGNNFFEQVVDSNKDVLVEFYAPWCGHCKALAPIYEEVAQSLKSNNNIMIAKVDATQNEIQGLQISGYPTLYFYSAKNKSNPVQYEGPRTKQGILDYLKQNTAFEWVVDEL